MIACDRCHQKFSSYSALDQHYDRRHASAQKPEWLTARIVDERKASLEHKPSTFVHKSSRVKLGVFLLVVVLAAVLVGYVATNGAQGGKKAVDVGSIAPNFTLTDTQGGTFTLSQFRGRSDVLLFFNEGLSCSPCLQQMTDMDQLNSQLTSMNITVASITSDDMGQLASWAQASGPRDSRVLNDQSLSVSRAYDMLGGTMHPGSSPGHTFVLIDKGGLVVWRHDYYPPSMYVDPNQLLSDVKSGMSMGA